ncbi:NAD(P)/FAD-dependent oxidoreductase [Natrarchaeobius oligotrophus]|uniref:FAD-binding oxidoreductase n=1 Tax=Natrarchaeobius chitinivorans TaxID=1679083 RepID=A0A3N6LZC0_NATCH|nr:FAD-dependent oxidoreductase [Natrarchaeobius chitinivorans]RQG94527.1 FAD-binding oxidoreductase [Natrarchaeobius chitinivorans]
MRIGVIGGGVYGTAISYFLKQFGADDVILFEQDSIGGTSTAKSAGIVRQHYSNRFHIRFAKRGVELLQELDQEINQSGGVHQNGYLLLADDENESQFRKNVALQKDLGIEVEILGSDEVSDVMPGLNTEDVVGAALEHKSGFADPYLVASSYAQLAQELGVTVQTNSPITDISVHDGTVTSVITPDQIVDVDFLINAGGPSADTIAAMGGYELELERHEAKIVVLTASESYGPDRPVLSDLGLGLYAKPEPGGDFIIGGMERNDVGRTLTNETDLKGVSHEDLDQVLDFLEHRLPNYSDAEIVQSWSGLITASNDWHQVIGVPEGYENFYMAAAGSGHGFKEAPAFAESAAQDVLDQTPNLDLSSYHPDRFDYDELITSGYDDGGRG